MQIGPNMGTGIQRAVPKPLSIGNRVAVIAPASPVDPTLLSAGVAILASWGLDVEVFPHVADAELMPFTHLAGSDAARREDFVDAMCSPDISAVFCARGGTGAGRTLEALSDADWLRMSVVTPRWFIGSSDATALHSAIASRLNWATLFGPMSATAVFNDPHDESAARLRDALFSPEQALPIRGTTLVSGSPVTAPVCGGTITVLASLVGTGDLPAATGHIALLEDVGEAPRRLDRSLTQLRRAGWFDGAKAVLIGSLIDCGAGGLDIVTERLSDLGIPVAYNVAVGHGSPQLSIPFGVPMTFDPASATAYLA